MNAITKVGARWFPIHERATAAAIPALAQFIGIIVAMAVTPILVRRSSITGMLQIYGLVSLGVALATLVFLRERPPTPPSPADQADRFTVFAGLKHIFRQRDMRILLALFFVNLGMFNAISTWIEPILAPRGFTAEQAGVTGAVMVGGGVFGAAILPILSDRLRRRKLFLVIAIAGMAPGLLGLALASGYRLLLASSLCFGFFLMSAYPIGLQYSAEVSYPAPESTAQGLIILAGQISGVLFIFGMDAFKAADSGSMSRPMLVFVGLTAIVIALTTRLRESRMIGIESS